MPKRRTKNPFPIQIYDTINDAGHSRTNLSSNNSQHVVPIISNFSHGDKKWKKTMYINLRDLNAYRGEILGLMTKGMNKHHLKAHKKVIYSVRDELGELERKIRGCIQIKNKKKGLYQDLCDKYYNSTLK